MTDSHVHLAAQAGPNGNSRFQQATQLASQLESAFFHGISTVRIENGTFVQRNNITITNPDNDVPRPDATFNRNVEATFPKRQVSTTRYPHEIYHDELFKRKRGSPLWIPGPGSKLPQAYLRNGVNIGDVGIISMGQPFDFLFNLFLPPDHPINSRGVPDSFHPLTPGDIDEFKCDVDGGYVGSSSLRQCHLGSESSSLQFQTSASGAILVMPQGAHRKEVKSIQKMRAYMTPSTIKSWYKYAMEVRGRELQNGDIRLVYACDKAPSWGIATVSGTDGHPVSLTFKEVKDQGRRCTYKWEYSGTADVARKVGPSRDENRDLDGVVDNQCLFLRTLNAQFSDKTWKEIEDQNSQHSPTRIRAFAERRPRKGNSSLAPHPSSILNRSLLENSTDEMVITLDDDWISLMNEGVLLDGQPPGSGPNIGDLAVARHVGTISVMQPESNENPGTSTLEKESSPTSTVNAIHTSEASGNSNHATRDRKRSRASLLANFRLWRSEEIRTSDGVVASSQLAINYGQGLFSMTQSITKFFSNPFSEAKKAIKKATIAMSEYQDSQQEQYLLAAITHYRHAYEKSNEKYKKFPDIITNYAALLNKQDRLSGGKFNLKEVIRLLEEGRVVMERQTPRTEKYGVLLNYLGQVYFDRYQISKSSQDLTLATDTFNAARSQNSSSPVSLAYASSLIGSATTLWTACELQPQGDDLARLNRAIYFLKTAQKQNDINMQMECCMNLALVYDLLHKRTTSRNYLDLSIAYYTQVLDLLHPQSPNRAPTLLNLSKQHFERHMLTKDQADSIAAQQFRDEAQTLVDIVHETEQLKKKIASLSYNMGLYTKRGVSYETLVTECTSEDGQDGRQGTRMLSDSITGRGHVTEPGTFTSFPGAASGSQGMFSSLRERSDSIITGETDRIEPRFDSDRRSIWASVSEAGMHKNRSSEAFSVQPEIYQHWQPAPSRMAPRNKGGERMVQRPRSVFGHSPPAAEPGQSRRPYYI